MREKKRDRLGKNPLEKRERLESLISNTGKEGKEGLQDNLAQVRNAGLPEKPGNASTIEKEEKDDFIVRTFKVRRIYDETLDRIAFWEHEWKQDVLDEILEAGLGHRVGQYDEIPPGKKGK